MNTSPTIDSLKDAAAAIASALKDLDISYAITGGVACNLLGSMRVTFDLDVVLDKDGTEIVATKYRVAEHDARFVVKGQSLYFNDIGIEMLTNRAFVWPTPLGSSIVGIKHGGTVITVLSPAALLVSKCQRMAAGIDSTRPATRAKFATDSQDVAFIAPMVEVHDIRLMLGQMAPEKGARVRSNLLKVAQVSSAVDGLVSGL